MLRALVLAGPEAGLAGRQLEGFGLTMWCVCVQTFQRVPSSSRGGVGSNSYRGRGGGDSAQNTARSGGGSNQYGGQDPALIASKAVEERVRRLEIQVNNFDKGMAKCLSQIVRLLQGLY